jgi:hypothetical protein
MSDTVKAVQRALIARGHDLGAAGADGVAGANTWAAINKELGAAVAAPAPSPVPVAQSTGKPFYVGAAVRLTDADFAALAARHGIEEAKIRAVNEVEASGKGFYSSGALVCLYEPHIAWRYTTGKVRDALVSSGLAYQKWKSGSYPKTSFERIDMCAAIAGEEVASLATSWGLGQIMGFNHKACGFDTALEMVKSFAESETNQLEGMIRFIKSNSTMLSALQRGDWAAFAKAYNGAGYAANKYDTKLAAAYARHKKG